MSAEWVAPDLIEARWTFSPPKGNSVIVKRAANGALSLYSDGGNSIKIERADVARFGEIVAAAIGWNG